MDESCQDLRRRCEEAERRADHTHEVLMLLRRVNAVVAEERDAHGLMQRCCEALAQSRNIHNAWAVLWRDGTLAEPVAHAGFDVPFEPMARHLGTKGLPECASALQRQPGAHVVSDPASTCTDCPLAAQYAGRSALVMGLEHNDNVLGWLCISVPKSFVDIKDETGVFAEVGAEISRALHAFETKRRHRQTETALHESEDRFAAAFHNAPVFIVLCDADDERYLDANGAFLKRMGYTREAVLGRTGVELGIITPETRDRLLATLRGQGCVQDMEVTLTSAHGDPITCLYSIESIEADGQSALLSIGVDITDRKRAEKALRASEVRFQRMLGLVPDMISIHDPDMNILYSNWQGFAAAPEERRALGSKCYQVYRQLDAICPDCRAREVLESGQPVQSETELPEGRWVDLRVIPLLDENGDVEFFMEWVRDITAWKEVEEALRKSEQQKNLILNATAEMIAYYDTDLRVIWANRAAGASVGQSPDDLKGLYCYQIWHQRSRPCPDCPVLKARDAGTPQEAQVATPDGRHWNVRGYPVHDEQGNVVALVEFGQDITQRVQAEQERAELEEQYRQAHKMEAIGQLTGGVAHDFNNLLQVIQSNNELAMEELSADHPVRQLLSEMMDASDRAAQIVAQLLTYSRQQAMTRQPFDVNEAIEAMLKLLGRVLGENIELAWQPGSNTLRILADRGMFDQVLMNLCLNARDAMPQGGRITISAKRTLIQDNGEDCPTVLKPGDYVLLTVCDTGCGMDEETMERAFEPFFSTKEVGKGTGLGLSTVYGILRQHDGIVTVQSALGHGSTFEMLWPSATNTATTQTDQSGKVETRSGEGRETILLAEDEKMVRHVARRILEREGYHVLSAKNGAQALALFQHHGDEIDLVILDVMMPKMDGMDTLAEMRKMHPGLKALFASGYSRDVFQEHFAESASVRFIQKPYSRMDLLAKVRETIDTPPPPGR